MRLTFTLRDGSTATLDTERVPTLSDLEAMARAIGWVVGQQRKNVQRCAAALNGELALDGSKRRCARRPHGQFLRDGFHVCDAHAKTKKFNPHSSAVQAGAERKDRCS